MAVPKERSRTGVPAPEGSPGAGRERILNAAYALFIEHGFTDVSMQEIAEAAGVTKGAPYYHFKDKEALFGEIVLREMERIRGNLVDLLERDAPFRERLELVAAFVVETRGSDLMRLFADLESHVSRERQAALRERFEPPYRILKSYFEAAAAAGEFSRVAPETAAAIFHAMVYGQIRLAQRRASVGDAAALDVMPNTIVDVLFSGI